MYRTIVGMDEVGRGCWAGPLVVGAVILKSRIPGVKDSKLLSRERRNQLDEVIRRHALAVGLGWANVAEINEVGLTHALQLAFMRALAEIHTNYSEVIIDGNYNFLPGKVNVRTIIDADATEPSVSAASIIAKVARDNYMISISKQYPGYGFEKHVGYGTRLHQSTLDTLGLCDLHRTVFKPVQLRLARS